MLEFIREDGDHTNNDILKMLFFAKHCHLEMKKFLKK